MSTDKGSIDRGAPALVQRIRRAYHQVFGVPDYAAYVAHMRATHPDLPCLAERDFCARSIERKYSRNGPRCC